MCRNITMIENEFYITHLNIQLDSYELEYININYKNQLYFRINIELNKGCDIKYLKIIII